MKKDNSKYSTPLFANFFLKQILNQDQYQEKSGDLEEVYRFLAKDIGSIKAKFWLWYQIIKTVPLFISNALYWSCIMLKNYLKIAFRNITKHKLNSSLNIVGLSLGITCCLLIFFHVKDELSYEKSFPKSNRIYRITINSRYGDTFRHWAVGPPPMGIMIQNDIPEIETVTRFRKIGSNIFKYVTPDGSMRRFEEKRGFMADSSAINLFDLKFIAGDPNTALKNISSIIINSSMAKKYFGDENPVGKQLIIENVGQPATVTGVFEDIPTNTHLQLDYLIPMSVFYAYTNKNMLESRTWKAVYTYVLLHENQTKESAESKIPKFMLNFFQGMGTEEEIFNKRTIHFQPIQDIHLHSKLEQEMHPNSDMAYVYIFSLAAIFILVIAGVNFINISTAQSFKRMKEVGVRKVIGAYKQQIIKQHLGESFILSILATALSLLLLYIFIPIYNNISGKTLYFSQILSIENVLLLILLIFFIGLMAGLYPAFFISTFRPANIFRSRKGSQSSVSILRKGLVIFQCIISIFMIFSTITIYNQLIYFQEKDLGFDKDKILAVKLYGELRRGTLNNYNAVSNEMLKYPGISNVSLSTNLIGQRFSVEHVRPESISEDVEIPTVRVIRVDEIFLNTLKIELLEGRNFRKVPREERQFILSESAVKALNIKNPIGQKAQSYVGNGEIVGVMEDFHFASLHKIIEPLVLDYEPNWASYLLIKYQGNETQALLNFSKETLGKFAPDFMFQYTFLDDQLNQLYVYENNVSDIFKIFSILSILISCLGLFGLSVYSTELKIKEIGVRKVFGASVPTIIFMLSKEFLKWVFIANILALPLAYWMMNRWLENFAYQININITPFLFSAVLAILFVIFTVSYQSIKAATANPAEVLKYE